MTPTMSLDWLPVGWTVKTRRRKNGKLDRYYTSPGSRSIFHSKAAVLRCLNFEKFDGPSPELTNPNAPAPPIKTSPLKKAGSSARRSMFVSPKSGCGDGIVGNDTPKGGNLNGVEGSGLSMVTGMDFNKPGDGNIQLNAISEGQSKQDQKIILKKHEAGSTNKKSTTKLGKELAARCNIKMPRQGNKEKSEPKSLPSERHVTSKCGTPARLQNRCTELSSKCEARASLCGRSTKLSLKYETRASQHDRSTELSSKCETRSSSQMSSLPRRTSKRLAGLDPDLTAVIESSNQSRETRSSSQISSLPHRTSKRLAGLDPDLTAVIESSNQSRRKTIKHETVLVDSPSNIVIYSKDSNSMGLERSRNLEIIDEEPSEPTITIDSKEGPGSMETDNKKKELSSLVSPFGDTWPDPCIEFAFKTLTGDISNFEDPKTIANYFKQQMTGPNTTSTSPTFGGLLGSLIQPNTSSAKLDDGGVNGLNATATYVKSKQEGIPSKEGQSENRNS